MSESEKEYASRFKDETALLAELYKLRVFDWGGIHQNDINKYIVDNYVKKYVNYDELVTVIDTEVINSLRGFTLCSWYNNWTSIIIEDIFLQHDRILPAIGRIKMVDFFIDLTPFDLKVTYFPAGYMADKRRQRNLPISELSELKSICRRYKIPFDNSRKDSDLQKDIIAALSETSLLGAMTDFEDFKRNRKSIIHEVIKNPYELIVWLYENQGTQRFDSSNRIFLILIDSNNLEDSWKLKRDKHLLDGEISEFLDAFPNNHDTLKVDWSAEGKDYISYAGILFIIK